MPTIKTKNFRLATYARGEANAAKLALILPGRLDTKDYANNTSLVDFLATKGFLAVSFDPPGTWESEGSIEEYSTTSYIQAIHEVIEHYGNRPTLLVGHSRGGTVSILASDSNTTVAGIIMIMGNFGPPTPPGEEAIRQGYKRSQRDLPPGTHPTDHQKEFDLPISYFEDGASYAPTEVLNRSTKPKLFIYGTDDVFTTPEENQAIFEAAPEPKMIHELKTTHDYRYDSIARNQVNKIVEDFLGIYEL